MAKLDKLNRLKIPSSVYHLSDLEKNHRNLRIYYSFSENGMYISHDKEDDFVLASIKLDNKYRFVLAKDICKSFGITKQTVFLICEKDGKIYLKIVN